MTPVTSRSVLRRLPVLVVLLWALLAAPQLLAAPVHRAPAPGASACASATSAATPQAPAPPAGSEDRGPETEGASCPVAGHPAVLSSQLAAGPSGSRAPPVAAA